MLWNLLNKDEHGFYFFIVTVEKLEEACLGACPFEEKYVLKGFLFFSLIPHQILISITCGSFDSSKSELVFGSLEVFQVKAKIL